jgi:hypothetical protein
MATEAGHIQITEFNKETIPKINWMMEDLFCQYGINIPYFMLDFDFPDYLGRPNQWGEWGYHLPWFNELLGLLFDTAGLPRWRMPDFSPASWGMFNSQVSQLYEAVLGENEYSPIGGNYLRNIRRAASEDTYVDTKDKYENDPGYCQAYPTSYDILLRWTIWNSDQPGSMHYQLGAHQAYSKFDTRNVTSVSTAKLTIPVNEVRLTNVTENPIVYIYKYDFGDSLECADWEGGSKIAEREFTSDDDDTDVDIILSSDDVVTSDYTRYRFTMKKIEELDYWPEPLPREDYGHTIICNNIKLVLT